MIRPLNKINEDERVTNIVIQDYRTVDVLRKFGIDCYFDDKYSLKEACEIKGLDSWQVKKELEEAIRTIHISTLLPFTEWPLDFLVDYIVYFHHGYLRKALPILQGYLEEFATDFQNEYQYQELRRQFTVLYRNIPLYLQQQEEMIFPYIRQITRAYYSKAPFAGLLTRTLRKPVENVMDQEHELIEGTLNRLRELTGNYTLSGDADKRHRIIFLKFQELDNDLVQHIHVENNIILPRFIAMESELSNLK